ncbi:hypothetical protein HOS54_gp033 [Klebsiella phage Menlow]|nr:hypothetical protein HOS54_gp033 [Klebsiella phage Menlow]AUG87916.1 hypothetical protein CPT_Menlow_215 [Klebsiella phage Menlow]
MVKEPVKKPKDLEEESEFKKLFGNIFKDIDFSKAKKWNFRTGKYDE